MSKPRTSYTCSECGWSAPKWQGQCRGCLAWGTLEESAPSSQTPLIAVPATPARTALSIAQVPLTQAHAWPTGIGELDRVLGGGIVPGAVVLLAGEPGVGKSTLLLEVAAKAAAGGSEGAGGGRVLYLTGEESAAQVRLRAERIGALADELYLAAENSVEQAAAQVAALNPSLLIVDSVQTFSVAGVEGAAGGVAQVRAVTAGVIAIAKERNIPVLLVGHVTKDGGIAGPRVLEHLVDVVCQFEGERHGRLRLLRAVKNRYGPTDEVGCFDLSDKGLLELPDPSGLFLSHASPDTPGTCVTVSLEGRRPLPVEIQALVSPCHGGSPRRTTSGVEHSRVAMGIAVLQARLHLDFASQDVYVSTVGGAKTAEPAVDLATALAVASAYLDRPVSPRTVAIGEVSLTGEIRPAVGVDRRLSEAARLGFTSALVPAQGAADITVPPGMRLLPVLNLADAIAFALEQD